MRKTLLSAAVAGAIGLCSPVSGFGAVDAPSDLSVVPRYDGASLSMVLTWTDNSHGGGNEEGFEIQAREAGVGAAFATIDTVGAGVTQYEDTAATGDKWWEYRVRATHSVQGDSAWTAPSDRNSPRQKWPINDGSHNVLYTHAQPISAGGDYFHGGTDISGGGNRVDVARGGVVTAINGSVGGTLEMDVDFGADGVFTDMYLHTDIDPVHGVGDNLVVGDDVGDISTTYFGHADQHHVHWGLKFHSLAKFTDVADLDPNNTAPVVADTNGDGDDFIVVNAAAHDHSNPREPAWGEVDFLVDAFDDMTPGNTNRAAPRVTGYWIQAGVPAGENVRNGTDYYRLLDFNFPRTSYSGATGVETDVFYKPLPGNLQGANIWGVYLTWIPTNASGTTGALTDVDPNQFWKTDARKGSGTEPNGSDAARARENQDARFPDGTYFVHIMLEDFVHRSDTVRTVVVDNSRPYVERVTVFSGPRIVYQARWVWDAAAGRLELQPATFDAAAAFTALRTQDVIVEVEFSEPMQTASIAAVTPSGGAGALGVTPTLASSEPAHARKIWRGTISNLDVADDGSHDGTHMLTIDGRDLAGNPLLRIDSRAAMGADHHNRNAGGTLQGTAGTDTIHGFRVAPLSGVIPVTAIFMKQGAADPGSPTIAAKSLALQTALNDYYDEVSYGEISFAVNGHGWYQLQHPLAWYETAPRTPLVDLVQEAISAAEAGGVGIAASSYVLVVTDETVARTEWSTNGAWPYELAGSPGRRLIAGGTLNLASTDARVTNLAGRLVGLIDLFAYPEVTFPRPFVGPWSHMSDKDTQVHVLGWEKWRVGWLDESGTATGKTLTRVAKPAPAVPITNQTHTIQPLDDPADGIKMVAIELADGLHYTATYRRAGNLDAALPSAGVLLVKANDRVNQGEGPAIVQESPVTAGDLADAPFVLTVPRDEFDDVGSGVHVEVTALDASQAQIRLDYAVPATQNDVWVAAHDDRWKTDDIWVDAPDPGGGFAADPRSVRTANEKPVVGRVNKLIGRVRNQGRADATNFEVELEILEPWGSGGPWRSLDVRTVPLLQGQDTNPSADYLIEVEWTPQSGTHTCVRLRVRTVANDVNPENNATQENIHEFETWPGSPYVPVSSRFQFENPFDQTVPILFRVDGLPDAWSYSITPERPVLAAGAVGEAEITLQPNDEAPLCTQEEVTVTVYAPRVDTLKRLGGLTLATHLMNAGTITGTTRLDCPKGNEQLSRESVVVTQPCSLVTHGCTDPALANTQVAVIYDAPDGSTQVRYVTTDGDGCYQDIVPAAAAGLWETEVVLEEGDCRAGDRTGRNPVFVPPVGAARLASIGVFTGGNWPLGSMDDDYDPSFTFFADAEWPLGAQWRLGVQIGFHEFDAEAALAIDNLGVTNLSAIARRRWGGGAVHPYVVGGLGGYESDGDWDQGAQAGVGFEVPLTTAASMAAGVTVHHVDRDAPRQDLRWLDAYLGFRVAWR